MASLHLRARRGSRLPRGILLTAAGCILKNPPDAATIKEEALPTVTPPERVDGRLRVGAPSRTTGSRRSATIS